MYARSAVPARLWWVAFCCCLGLPAALAATDYGGWTQFWQIDDCDPTKGPLFRRSFSDAVDRPAAGRHGVLMVHPAAKTSSCRLRRRVALPPEGSVLRFAISANAAHPEQADLLLRVHLNGETVIDRDIAAADGWQEIAVELPAAAEPLDVEIEIAAGGRHDWWFEHAFIHGLRLDGIADRWTMRPQRQPNIPRAFELMCHYMAWFQHFTADGERRFDHWQWQREAHGHDPQAAPNGQLRDIASVYYPRVGLYDSRDPDLLDYHILTAKAAGIDGFIVDWYEPDTSVDLALGRLLSRAAALDFKVAICFEEKTCFPDWYPAANRAAAVARAAERFNYLLARYASQPAYWRVDGRPAILMFGGWGPWVGHGERYFTPAEITELYRQTQPHKWSLVRQNHGSDYADVPAAFAWNGNDDYLDWFYRTGDAAVREQRLQFYLGSVSPGFDDRGTWGWDNVPRFEANLGLENYQRYWTAFAASTAGYCQVITWNDFAEGTVIEPTAQWGHLYVDETERQAARIRGLQPDLSDNRLGYRWYVLCKLTDATQRAQLDLAREQLAAGDGAAAEATLTAVAAASGVDVPPFIGVPSELPPVDYEAVLPEPIAAFLGRVRSANNLASAATVAVSSAESDAHPGAAAADGSLVSRWSSAYADGQWLKLDLGEVQEVAAVEIFWEDAYAAAWRLQVSADAEHWDTVAESETGRGGLVRLAMPGGSRYRWLKLDCLSRATKWGFSIRELAVMRP